MKIVSVLVGLVAVCLLASVCFAGPVKAGVVKKEKYPEETKKLLEKIKTSGSKDIGQLIYTYTKEEPTDADITALYNLMDNKEVILKDDPKYAPAKIQVRDIAFVCIQELTGNVLKNEYKTKETISYQSEDGGNYEFIIPAFSESEYKAVKAEAKHWVANYKKLMEKEK